MLKQYNAVVRTDPDNKLRIIGTEESPFSVLKIGKDIAYAGSLADCEFVASVFLANEAGRPVDLFLDVNYTPCTYALHWARVAGGDNFQERMIDTFDRKAHYTVEEGAGGSFTTVVRDRNSGAALTIRYHHGIKLTW